MPNPLRVFDFDVGTSMGDALRTIRAALDDEGMALGPTTNATMDKVTSVIVGGRQLFRVPMSRIWEKREAVAYYEALPPRHEFVSEGGESRRCAEPCGQDRGHPVHRIKEV